MTWKGLLKANRREQDISTHLPEDSLMNILGSFRNGIIIPAYITLMITWEFLQGKKVLKISHVAQSTGSPDWTCGKGPEIDSVQALSHWEAIICEIFNQVFVSHLTVRPWINYSQLYCRHLLPVRLLLGSQTFLLIFSNASFGSVWQQRSQNLIFYLHTEDDSITTCEYDMFTNHSSNISWFLVQRDMKLFSF